MFSLTHQVVRMHILVKKMGSNLYNGNVIENGNKYMRVEGINKTKIIMFSAD